MELDAGEYITFFEKDRKSTALLSYGLFAIENVLDSEEGGLS